MKKKVTGYRTSITKNNTGRLTIIVGDPNTEFDIDITDNATLSVYLSILSSGEEIYFNTTQGKLTNF